MPSISTLFRFLQKTIQEKAMAKKMVHVAGGGRTLKKRIIEPTKNQKKPIHKVIDYLLSDSYLFAPLISSHSPRKGIEIRERTKDHNPSLLKKIEDYLKSDCYMYAPLVAPQSFRARVRGCVGYVKKVTTEVSTTTSIRRGDEVMAESAANMTKEERICTTDFVEATVLDQQINTLKESSNRTKYPNCRSSSISEEGMRDPKMRKI